MQFKTDASETNGQDIVSYINFLCDSDSTSYPIASKVRNTNAFYEELIGKIISADGTWQYDDTNQSTEPVARGTLVEGQQRYSFTSEYLDITMIEILNQAGTQYEKIFPLDHQELGDLSPEQYFGTDSSGNPTKGKVMYYDKQGDTIYLYNAPAATSHTLTNGIRVWFKRTADLFTISDTTQEPGLPSPYHSILAYGAALPYCMLYKKDRVPLYQVKVNQMMEDLLKFYNRREKDKRNIMTHKRILYY